MRKKLLCLFFSLFIALSSNTIAFAEVDKYLIKDKSDIVYEYDVKELTESIITDVKFFNDFYNKFKMYGLYAIHDNNGKGKYVSQKSIDEAKTKDKKLDVDKFISSEKAKPITIKSVKKVTSIVQSTTTPTIVSKSSDIDIAKAKSYIKNTTDLEKYLNENFNELKAPLTDWKFKIKVTENTSAKNIMNTRPYDFAIAIDWTNEFNPYDLLSSSKIYSEKEKRETINLLAEYQLQMYDFLISLYPDKKIQSTFYSNNTNNKYGNYGTLVRFLTWTNYSNPSSMHYSATKQSEFNWFSKLDLFSVDKIK